MNCIFVDTSAFFALLDADDTAHAEVKTACQKLFQTGVLLMTSNYILVETCALVQNRLGMEAARMFMEDIVPLFDVRWIDAQLHHAAASAHLAAGRRHLSLVDCSSFEVMRRTGIRTAFTCDKHFREQGFATIP
ncbi:MAG TPA: PIN domain-containing protein [Desulfuromonadales bacterium]|nr:PIN domain-containing protein [Desulfuromonadales bacterium]